MCESYLFLYYHIICSRAQELHTQWCRQMVAGCISPEGLAKESVL